MGGSGSSGPARSGPRRVPALGETLLRTMMISSGGAIEAARAQGAWVVTPPTMGVGLLEFHQLDEVVRAGRLAARALLDEAGADIFVSDAATSTSLGQPVGTGTPAPA
jgi:NTE family protein